MRRRTFIAALSTTLTSVLAGCGSLSEDDLEDNTEDWDNDTANNDTNTADCHEHGDSDHDHGDHDHSDCSVEDENGDSSDSSGY